MHANFGPGVRRNLPNLLSRKRCLLVATARGRQQIVNDATLRDAMNTAARVSWADAGEPYPSLANVQKTIEEQRGLEADLIVGFGGGSCIDTAKILSVGLAPGAQGRALSALVADVSFTESITPIPVLAIPTTAGSGSEVTPFATIWDRANGAKLSLVSSAMVPKLALVDPQLTMTLPWEVTLSSGLDALCHAFESVWSKDGPSSMQTAALAIGLALQALPALRMDLANPHARNQMSQASLAAGSCIASSRTSLCHSISYPLTIHLSLPHGLACGFTLLAVAELCEACAPIRLDSLAAELRVDRRELTARLSRVLELLEVRRLVKDLVPNVELMTTLHDHMRAPERWNNFVVTPPEGTLKRILQRSYAE